MNYSKIDCFNREHVITLIRWLFNEVLSAGGDGDGIWYSHYFDIEDILQLIADENLCPSFFKAEVKDSKTISFGRGEEWLIITNDKEVFNNRPSWQQISLSY